MIIECHPEPEKSVSDARQALSLEDMVTLVESLKPVAAAVGRVIPEVIGVGSKPTPIHLARMSSDRIAGRDAIYRVCT